MGVFLSVLKIIGLILLNILCFVLLLVLIILIAPIHYEGEVSFDEKANAKIKVGWLLFIRFYLNVVDNKLDYAAKLFGLQVFPKKKKKKKGKEEEEEQEEISGHMISEAKTEPEEEKPEKEAEKKEEEKPEIVEAEEKEEEKEKDDTPLIDKIGNVVERAVYVVDNTTCALADENSAIFRFLSRRSTKNSFVWTKTFLFKVIKHIKPQKLMGDLELGLDDPAVTGYIFAVLSQFYENYYNTFTLMPNFEEKTIKGKAYFNGRIVLGYIVVKALRLYLRKQFRQFIKNAKALKNDTMKNIEKIKDGITNYG